MIMKKVVEQLKEFNFEEKLNFDGTSLINFFLLQN